MIRARPLPGESYKVAPTSLPTAGFDWTYSVDSYRESGYRGSWRSALRAIRGARRRASASSPLEAPTKITERSPQ